MSTNSLNNNLYILKNLEKEIEDKKVTILLPTYSHVKECEDEFSSKKLEIQSLELGSMVSVLNKIMELKEMIGNGYFGKITEDVLIFMYHIMRARSKLDYTVAVLNFAKLRTNSDQALTSILAHKLYNKYCELFTSHELAIQGFEELLNDASHYLAEYDNLKSKPVYKKLYKFGMYALSLNLFEKLGLTFDNLRYSKVEAEAVKRQHSCGFDFVHTVLDTIVFLCQRGYQCMKSGTLYPIYHSGAQYEKWYEKFAKLELQSTCLAFPEAHGFNRFTYLADLRSTIEEGEAIKKFSCEKNSYDQRFMTKSLAKLNMLLAAETTKREALKERRSPFGVLLYGGSSIGKSTLTQMLFYQYSKVFDLPNSSEFKYTRNPADQYWSNFNSTQWCVIMDDMAFRHPNKASDGDSSVMEVLQVVNNIAYVPTQADVADKGKTPLRARLVIGSTNCEDLNAYAYYQTPLAVRRRLPFIIDVQPKPEYAKHECMLDSSKVEMVDGQWPDYWLWTIKRVVPAGTDRVRQRATEEVIFSTSDVNDFLAWFAREAVQHEKVQDIVNNCDEQMLKLEICKTCYYLKDNCKCEIQVGDDDQTALTTAQDQPTWRDWISFIFITMLLWSLRTRLFKRFLEGVIASDFLQRFIENRMLGEERANIMRARFRRMGERAESSLGKHTMLITVAAKVVVALTAYKVASSVYSHFKADNREVQGGVHSSEIGQRPTGKDEKENPWVKNDFVMTTFDVNPPTTSTKHETDEGMDRLLSRNLYHFRSVRCVNGETKKRVIRAIAIKGHIYMCNNHGLPDDVDYFMMTIQGTDNSQGVNPNMEVKISQKDIIRYPKMDVAFVRIRNVPPRKDISLYFPRAPIKGNLSGRYLGRNEDGSLFNRKVGRITFGGAFSFKRDNVNFDFNDLVYNGVVNESTVKGDCGAVLVARTGLGSVILGQHFLGGGMQVYANCITSEFLFKALSKFDEPQIQSGKPMLSSESAKRDLLPLYHKAPIRYFEEGTAQVYGSFNGFRGSHKSKVTKTCIAASMEQRGYEIKHGKPVMQGWEPWHIALKDMIKPVVGFKNDILQECVDSFVSDILKGLPKEDLKEIHVYDDMTVVNGAPGVAFVDKMNRNSSAGNPWKKSKRFFMLPALTSDQPEAMIFNKEIMDRVQDIIDCYDEGKRCMPNFCGHLKDEATSFAKIDMKKTRVFTGAPVDWSFVVRKYCLAFVRVMQKNRYLFEAAPGTNCASQEWGNMYKYLTKFGTDRMVAGDFKAYDKNMSSNLILAAFDIIRRVCEAAGYSEQELRILQGIAEDTAFPLVDLNGDLIEFYGTNPSGHPLTVIINSLVNSLYLRYCYYETNPNKECKTFKEKVAFMSYGDDNIMGVSKKAEWFNHTSIQKTLADVGVTYTMADKEAESIPYIHIDDCTFLKRGWRYDNDVGHYLAPLEEDSIIKSLTVCVESNSLCPEAQAVAIMSSAHAEYFFYGKEKFEEKAEMFRQIVIENNLQLWVEDTTFPSWQQLKERFMDAHVRA